MVSAGTSSSYRHGMNLLKGPGAEGETCYTRNQLAAANISEGLQELSTEQDNVWGSDVTVRVSKLGEKGDQLGKDKGSLQQ